MYLYLKAIHIIFVVTWFAGLFYMPRLFIYNIEAETQAPEIQQALRSQFNIMMKRLWYGITWPSAIITLILGTWVLYDGGWYKPLMDGGASWLWAKLGIVVLLYLYHWTLHRMLNQQLRGEFRYTSNQMRVWNEVATIFLVAVVMLVVVKTNMSLLWGLGGLVAFVALLMSAIKIYKMIREQEDKQGN